MREFSLPLPSYLLPLTLIRRRIKSPLAALENESADKLILLGDLLYHGPRNDLPRDYAPKKVIEKLNGIKNKILAAANNAINTAEDTDKVEAEKMAVALAEIQKILPIGAKFIFTEERIRTLLQAAFDGIEMFAKKQANK